MLAKRLILVAFAALLVVGTPYAFPGNQGLLVDTPPALLTTLASR